MPVISVIIPVYNAEKYIAKCLDSVLASTLSDIEVICVDDGSTDDSLSILKQYKSRDVRVKVLHQKNSHAGVARNTGLEAAQGEYVHFLDVDDWIDATAYVKWIQLAKESSADVCACMAYTIDIESGKCIPNSYYALRQNKYLHVTNFEEEPKKLIYDLAVVPWNKIYLRKFLLDNKIRFDNLICANDRSFYYTVIYKAQRVAMVREYWIYHRVNNNSSLSGRVTRLIHFDVHFRSFEIIWKVMEKADVHIKKMVLDVHIDNSIYFYRKAIGGEHEKPTRKALYNFWKDYIPILGVKVFATNWFPHYMRIISELKASNVDVENYWYYKIGEVTMFIPIIICRVIRCWKRNGFIYTLRRCREKIKGFPTEQ
jgi:glycosyltransferase involved in cell wall biosynthesis